MKGGQTSKDGNIKVMQVSFEAPWRVNNLFFFSVHKTDEIHATFLSVKKMKMITVSSKTYNKRV